MLGLTPGKIHKVLPWLLLPLLLISAYAAGDTIEELEKKLKNLPPKKQVTLLNKFCSKNCEHYPEKSLEYAWKALSLARETGDADSIVNALNNIVLIYLEKKNYGEALKFFRKALTLFTDTDLKKRIGHALNNLGDAHAGLGNFPPALDHYRQAMVTYESIKFKWGIANTGKNIGKLYTITHDYENALPYLQKALKSAKNIKSDDLIIKSYIALTQLYEAMEKYDLALEYHKKYFQMNTDVYNERNAKQRIRLQAEYTVEKKENEIRLLRKDRDLRKAERVFLLISLFLSLLLVGVTYNL